MKRGRVARNIIRCIVLVLLQGVILKSITIDYPVINKINLIVYPLAFILLPIVTPLALQLIIGFICGLLLDFFYNSPGVHAATSLFIIYLRTYILRFIEPRGGYEVGAIPNIITFGSSWFFLYSGITLFIHLLILFSIQAFTLYFIFEILLKTILSFVASFVLMSIYMIIFNPEQ